MAAGPGTPIHVEPFKEKHRPAAWEPSQGLTCLMSEHGQHCLEREIASIRLGLLKSQSRGWSCLLSPDTPERVRLNSGHCRSLALSCLYSTTLGDL